MASKQDWSKTKQQSSTSNTTNNVTKTIADSMNTTLNYVTNVTNGAAPSPISNMLPVLGLGGLLLVVVFAVAFRR
jgi:beta-lactamase regulating signal transducer with metallopeptidase domain